jgi:16S rRNA (cytosine967-C5)-methyltransferase
LGAHQLFEMRVPVHAAVSATVELARKVLGESKASFVNALLRKVSAQSLDQWLAPVLDISDDVQRLSILYSHPEWIVSAYFDLLKDYGEVEKVLAANNVPAQPTFVTWPGRSTPEELLAHGGEATIYSRYGARLDVIPAEVEAVIRRRAGVQDEGSQLVAQIFSDAIGDRRDWLDICAGPGGKAALLASIAKSKNTNFTANEISEPRARLVSQVVDGARVWTGDARDISAHKEEFDAILADVPCTGLGALRRRPEVRWRRSITDLRALTELQREISDASIGVLRVGGIFGYATCSPHLAETRIAVADIAKRHPELKQLSVESFLPTGLTEATTQGCLTLWTHRHATDSMFLALFEKIS